MWLDLTAVCGCVEFVLRWMDIALSTVDSEGTEYDHSVLMLRPSADWIDRCRADTQNSHQDVSHAPHTLSSDYFRHHATSFHFPTVSPSDLSLPYRAAYRRRTHGRQWMVIHTIGEKALFPEWPFFANLLAISPSLNAESDADVAHLGLVHNPSWKNTPTNSLCKLRPPLPSPH